MRNSFQYYCCSEETPTFVLSSISVNLSSIRIIDFLSISTWPHSFSTAASICLLLSSLLSADDEFLMPHAEEGWPGCCFRTLILLVPPAASKGLPPQSLYFSVVQSSLLTRSTTSGELHGSIWFEAVLSSRSIDSAAVTWKKQVGECTECVTVHAHSWKFDHWSLRTAKECHSWGFHTQSLLCNTIYIFTKSAHCCCLILTKTGMFWQILVKLPPQYQISWKSVQWF